MTIIPQQRPPSDPSTSVPCPSWCAGGHSPGDHLAEPSSWPPVTATAYPNDGHPELTAAPTWGAVDGLDPAVALSIHTPSDDSTIDLTVAEAIDLGLGLIRAASAATGGMPTIGVLAAPSAIAVSVRGAAAELDLSESTIREAIDRQHLPAFRVGRAIRIDRADLLGWFRGLTRVGSEDDQ